MDFIENRTMKVGAMALDGLYERQKAIAANTVNVLTPGYQRRTVSFEDSLRNAIKQEDEREQIRTQNSIDYQLNPKKILQGQTPEQIAFLNSELGKDFSIDVEVDNSDAISLDGNNVNLEEEMMDEAQTGIKYQVISNLMSKKHGMLHSVIKGQLS